MAIQNAIGDKFQFTLNNGIKQGSTVEKSVDNLCLAIACGHMDVDGIEITKQGGDISTIELHHHNPVALHNAGYRSVNVVLDDLTAAEVAANGMIAYGSNGAVIANTLINVRPVDSDLPVRPTLNYLRNNPRYIKTLTIISDDEGMFDGKLELAYQSPFHHENTRSIELTQYYSVNQYRDTKISIDFAAQELQWNDSLLMFLKGIPAGCTVKLLFEFYAE